MVFLRCINILIQRLEKVIPMTKKIYEIILKCWEFEHEKRPNFGELFQLISKLDTKTLFE